MEPLVREQHIEQMPVLAAELDALRRAHGILPDDLVQLLAVFAERYGAHEDVLGRKKRQLFAQVLFHHARIYLAAAHDVGAERQNGVAREETLRQRETAVGRIVERALEHCVMAVSAVLEARFTTYRLSEHTRSQRMGLRL